MPIGPAIANVLTAGINTGLSVYNTDKTIQANKDLAKYQYSKDLEMYNRANTYNSPVEQMKRLREANLNPSLLSGSPANTTQVSMPKYQAPSVNYEYKLDFDIPAMLNSIQDYRNKRLEGNILKERQKSEEANASINQLNAAARSRLAGRYIDPIESAALEAWYKAQNTFKEWNVKTPMLKAQLSSLESQAKMDKVYEKWAEAGINRTDNLLLRMLFNKTNSKIKFPKMSDQPTGNKIGTAHGMWFNY